MEVVQFICGVVVVGGLLQILFADNYLAVVRGVMSALAGGVVWIILTQWRGAW